jgi:hypothetical protein
MNDLSARRRLTTLAAALLLGACSGNPVVGGRSDAGADAPDARDIVDVSDAQDIVDASDAQDIVDVSDVSDVGDAPAGCRANADCAGDPGGAVCDVASGRCVRCVASDDTCPAGQRCDPMSFVCVDGCRNDEGCAGPVAADGGAVDAGDDGGVPARVCDTAAHRCVQCRVDEHCPAGMLCAGQVCVMGCSATRPCAGAATCCDGACVDTQTNTSSCGACGTRCAVVNGSPACAAGRCAVASCTAPFADCNGDAADGCETDTAQSGSHCGMCGRACAFANATGACAMGACAISACNAGFADCDTSPANGCETDLAVTAASCGACGRACSFANAAASCAMGACVMGACVMGFADCDGSPANGCETPTTTTDHCGACGRSCSFANAAATCAMGACALGACRDGFADCDGLAANGCEADLNTSPATCGRCAVACRFANAAASCAAGSCALGVCDAGFADCDGRADNGCEVALAASASHCGACGRACVFPNAAATCAMGACAMGACATGFADCDGDPSNGCEVALATSAAHCGRCGNACGFAGGSAACVAGACQLTMCAAGRGDCDGDRGNGCETDLAVTVASCGACGSACVTANATPACAMSACAVASCDAGFADCNRRAVDGCEVSVRTDPSNCGACGRACALTNAVPACTAAVCTVAACATGFGDCDGRDDNGCETDLRSAVASCGVCGRACSFPNAGASCAMGACAMGACDAGFADCNGAAADGCEVDTRTNPSSCGGCGRACSFANATPLCAAGVCALGACNAGFANCDGNPANGCEADVRSAVDHCGACGRVCSTGRCTAGVCDRGGDGSDGALTVTTATTLSPVATPLAADVAAGATALRVVSATGITAGNEVLVIAMQGADAGHYEFGRVASVTSNTVTLAAGVAAPFAGSTERVQVVRVFRYSALTVSAGQTLATTAWNGSTGGVLPVRVAGAATLVGDLVASGRGFRGGAGDGGGRACGAGAQGESAAGVGGRATAANGGGGGGGGGGVFCCGGEGQSPGGGGGAYGAAGATGTGASGVGAAGAAYGVATLARMSPGAGGGGGGGNCDVTSGSGGAGGAVIYLAATTLNVTGNVTSAGAQGAAGGSYEGSGAGGAGGAVFLAGSAVTLTAGRVTAPGGASNVSASGVGGAGGAGRVRIECATLNGAACPGASGAVSAPTASIGAW